MTPMLAEGRDAVCSFVYTAPAVLRATIQRSCFVDTTEGKDADPDVRVLAVARAEYGKLSNPHPLLPGQPADGI